VPGRNLFTVCKVLLALSVLLLGADRAVAYGGPGVDVTFISYAMSLLAWVLVAFSAVLMWPIYALLRLIRRRNKLSTTATACEAAPEEVNSQETPVELGFVAGIGEFSGIQSVTLEDVTIPPAIIEMVPESVAREIVAIPLSQESGVLRIVVRDPSDFDTLQKLQFILNKDIQPVLAPKEQIVEAINRHYVKPHREG
jgi:hypothetical protein